MNYNDRVIHLMKACAVVLFGVLSFRSSAATHPMPDALRSGEAAATTASGQSASDGFFKLFEESTVKANRASCMGGARFTQSFGGNVRQSSVGRMSNGYFYGMMLNFSKQVCEAEKKTSVSSTTLNRLAGTNPSVKDGLALYGNLNPSNDPIIQNYSLMLPLGMIESGGKYDEGRDKSASNTSAATAEAGLFQVSYNSTNLHSELAQYYQELKVKYQNGKGSNCMTGVYGLDGAQNHSKNTESYGYGEGRQFQDMMKGCPAMATDYMALLLRLNYRHNGPLLRREARPRESCVQVLQSVKTFALNNCEAVKAIDSEFPQDPRAQSKFAVAATEDLGSYDQYRPEGERPRSLASTRKNASRLEEDAQVLEAEQKLLEEAAKKATRRGDKELAEALREQANAIPEALKALRENAQAIDNDPVFIKEKIQSLERGIENSNNYLSRAEDESKKEIEQLTQKAALLREQAKNEKNERLNTALLQEATETEALAAQIPAQVKEYSETMNKEIAETQKAVLTLKSRLEDLGLIDEKSKKLESLVTEIESLEAKTDADDALKATLASKVKERDALQKEVDALKAKTTGLKK